jgi:hypothetical protein
MLLVHHTDAVREYAYDRQSSVGKLNTAHDEAIAKHDRRRYKKRLENDLSAGWSLAVANDSSRCSRIFETFRRFA